ncbi:3-isopropylmalate dehydratase [Rhodohalobacter mucosus]|uniref:3-isopropylmalate dehydratase n=1 Tax=Rhodohalobacter mucosus TaxID=2079485 RepID=A0A316TPF2_9BACT|nr:3-isopropylmalate dehydratase [Rhodohalobacter mucosus]PWN05688.1 3-isopropylmalate dehydratase [Rhodohalobacter mucosus]
MTTKSAHIAGKAFVLGKNVDTDQIIPAAHLVYSLTDPEERKLYGKYALSGVPSSESGLPNGNIPFINGDACESEYSIIVASDNFGCGSSREHAPACLEIAGIKAIISPSYARIFYRNSVDGGFLTPYESVGDLSEAVQTGDELEIDPAIPALVNHTQNTSHRLKPLGSVADIVNAGGIFAYARETGMVPK